MLFQLFLLLFSTLIFLSVVLYIITHKDYIFNNLFPYYSQKIRKFFNPSIGQKIARKLQLHFCNKYIVYSKPSKSSSNKRFTVLTFNILAQRYLKRGNQKLSQKLEIKKRLQSIIIEIKSAVPDIFCLQEVTSDVYETYLFPSFKEEFDMICHNNEGSMLRNLIAVKKDRFEIINESKLIICDDSKKSNNKDNSEEEEEKNNSFCNKIKVDCNRGIIHVTLKDKQLEGKFLSVFCVHFPWKPIFEYQKARIMGLIFDFISKRNIDNVIIAGDFNSVPNSLVMRMVYYNDWKAEYTDDKEYINNFTFNKGEMNLNKDFQEKMETRESFAEVFTNLMDLSKKVNDRFFLQSAYASYRQTETGIRGGSRFSFLRNHPKYTNYTSNFIDTIDYIIFSKGIKKLKIMRLPDIEKEVLNNIQNNDKEDNKNDNKEKRVERFLPNDNHPSDHLKLVAHFEYAPVH